MASTATATATATLAVWQASADSCSNALLLNEQPAGHPNEALDTACTLYLADVSKPLKD